MTTKIFFHGNKNPGYHSQMVNAWFDNIEFYLRNHMGSGLGCFKVLAYNNFCDEDYLYTVILFEIEGFPNTEKIITSWK